MYSTLVIFMYIIIDNYSIQLHSSLLLSDYKVKSNVSGFFTVSFGREVI